MKDVTRIYTSTQKGVQYTKKSTLEAIERALAEARREGMGAKHIRALEGLEKVVRRGGAMGLAEGFLDPDGWMADLERWNRARGAGRTYMEQLCIDLGDDAGPFVMTSMGPFPIRARLGARYSEGEG